jgi:hypothetical protein
MGGPQAAEPGRTSREVLRMWGWATVAVVCLAWREPHGCGAAVADQPLERIAIREGRFVEADSGAPFTPLGVNYYRIAREPGQQSHAAFCPGSYDAAYVERMMAAIAEQRWNTVRVFHSALVGPSGLIESPVSRDINPAYLTNVLHFLRAARARGVRVIFTWDIWLPAADAWARQPLPRHWESIWQARAEGRQGVNAFRLAVEPVRKRAAGVVALIQAIKTAEPALLPVVLAWELENEVRFAVDQEPFVTRRPDYVFGGTTFDLSTDAGVQGLMDAAMAAWASACADAIHEADPQALVSASVFTFEAVGRGGPGTLSRDKTGDARVPAAPRALLGSRLDFIDIHLYAHRGPIDRVRADVTQTLESVEFTDVLREARRLGKPILAGEVGVSAGATRRPPDWQVIHHDVGESLFEELVAATREEGFAGALFWHYGNPDSQPGDEYPAVQLHPGYGARLRAAWDR